MFNLNIRSSSGSRGTLERLQLLEVEGLDECVELVDGLIEVIIH